MLKLNPKPLRKLYLNDLPNIVVQIASLIPIVCSILVLIGWYFDIDIIKSGCGLNRVSIKANTAVCFVLSGIALWLLQKKAISSQNKADKNRQLSPLWKFFLGCHQWLHFHAQTLAKVVLGLVIIISSLTLSEYLGNWNLGIDELLFSDASPASGTSYPGRMSFVTAVDFIFIGIAMILLSQQKNSRYNRYAQILSLISAVISFISILHYVYNQGEVFDHVTPDSSFMGFYQAVTFLILCIGMLWMGRDRGLLGMVIKKFHGTYFILRWLLLAIFILAIAGWFIIQGQRLNYYDSVFAIVLFVLVAIGFFAILIWEFAWEIEGISQQRDYTQNMLQAAQNRWQQVFDTNILGVICGDIHGGIQQANDRFLQMTGYSREELISGRINWKELTPANYISQDEQCIAEAEAQGNCQPYEKELLCKDGSHIPVLCSYGFPSAAQSDMIVLILDLSDRQQLKIASHQEKRKLKLLGELTKDIKCCPNPVVTLETWFGKLAPEIGLDAYWNYLVENNSPVMHLTSHSGISPTLAQSMEYLEIGRGVCGYVARELSRIALDNVQQSTEPKTEFIRSMGIKAYYGQALTMGGKLLGTIAFASCSRSQFSQSEQAIMEALTHLIAMSMERWVLTNSLQQQAEQIQDTNRTRDEFLSILSHELRSPLQSILGWAQLLRSRNLGETQVAKGLDAIERNAKTQTQIVEDLLDISRMIKGKLSLNIRTCDLVPILRTVLENVKLAAEVKEIDFSYSLDWGHQHHEEHFQQQSFPASQAVKLRQSTSTTPKFLVSGDPERLQQIIWNLLSNAIKFTPHGGRVEVILSQVEDKDCSVNSPLSSYAQIQVKDTGIGIDANLIPYVFDRFYQTDSSNTRLHSGMGLGLAIVRHLVELHGGIIEVESPGVGKGTSFTVKLPLFDTQPQHIREEKREIVTLGDYRRLVYPSSGGRANLSSSLLQGVRVLIVDNEVELQDFFLAVLQSYQAEARAVSSVVEALNAIQEYKPDVLVCDLEMPDDDGYSLIRQLRSLESAEKQRKIPAAALTADGRAEQRMRAIHEGYQIYLLKPVEPCELVTVVACLAGRT
ncbi:MAG: ATP-binding protein [Calothrix sp. MO_192.B10]|nr:ATP-binding protein [Calothrix sp. MO_192.B10]